MFARHTPIKRKPFNIQKYVRRLYKDKPKGEHIEEIKQKLKITHQ